jgi:methylamine dehydrogenase accessory protein MauD
VDGGVWIVSYVLLWIAVVVLSMAVVALLRQIGVLHARLSPLGVHFAGEGPELNRPAPPTGTVSYADAALTLVTFTSPTCEVCAELRPSLAALRRQYADVQLVEIEHGDPTRATFLAFNVSNTPYFVAVDRAGVVRGRGVANSLEQVEELIEEALRPHPGAAA